MSSAMNHAKRSHRSHRVHASGCTGVRRAAYYKDTTRSAGLMSIIRQRIMSKRRKVIEHRGTKETVTAQ